MNYPPHEIAELLKERPHQAHYTAALVEKALAPLRADAVQNLQKSNKHGA